MLALVRHGQTEWNQVGRFTGWYDEGLTEVGRADALVCGRELAGLSSTWDIAYTSRLCRSTDTAELAIGELPGRSPRIIADWRLNERHVGDLEGRFHAEIAGTLGPDAVERWRWGMDECPPLVAIDDPRQLEHMRRHPDLGEALPRGESLLDVMNRVRGWLDEVKEQVAASQHVVVFTHGTTLRALRVLIEDLGEAETVAFRPSNGGVVLYELQAGAFRLVLPSRSVV